MTQEEKRLAEAVEEAAGEQLGVGRWDLPSVFRESAEAATENTLPYWLVLVLSGGIATLGLALNSSAVVIGAMLVAPLLAPVIGLALSMAVGDGRLGIQTAAVVLGSTLSVVATSALLTLLLPFQTITLEITARTRPTTLDLVIAVFSGLVSAVVTVARGSRLSAAIPGVAISVALIPPLAVTGFGMGIGWNAELIRGSLLLYGANLAGIVLSGMLVFLLVGMHRDHVVDAARVWHRQGQVRGLAEWTDRLGWVRSIGVFRSPWARVGMVGAFAVALGFPLTESLAQIAREARVERAVSEAAERFQRPGDASLISRQVVYGSDQSQVYLRVATASWFGRAAKEAFEREASARAGEPIRLTLEQIPAGGEDVEELAALFRADEPQTPAPPATAGPTRIPLPALLSEAGDRLREARAGLALPGGMAVIGLELAATERGAASAHLAYAAAVPLPREAEEMLRAQLAAALGVDAARIRLTHVSTRPRPLGEAATDTMRLAEATELLRRYPDLAAEVTLAAPGDSARARAAAAWIRERGVAQERIQLQPGAGVAVALRPAPQAQAPPRD